MKMKPKELLHWGAILAFGCFGIEALVDCGRDVFRFFQAGDWVSGVLTILFTAVVAGLSLAVSWFTFRRQYRYVAVVVAVVASYFVFSAVMCLPKRLGIEGLYERHLREVPWAVLVGMPLFLLWFYVPFYAAAAFFRLCLRLADRYLLREAPKAVTN